MKLFQVIWALFFAVIITGCAKNKTATPAVTENSGLIGLSLLLYRQSQPGLQGYLQSLDDITSKGVNLFGMSPEWTDLEATPNIYSLQDQIVNPLTLLDPGKTKLKSYILVLKMIDTNRKILPSDLASLSFDDPQVISRFKSLIDNIATVPSVSRVSYILIGNEVDGYLSTNPAQLNAFATFYKQAINEVHAKMPAVKLGTIVTFNSLTNNPLVFNTLAPLSDFICYTYYPTDDANPNWQMRPPPDVFGDITLMAQKAGNKPFAFTEVGYPSSTENNSSEALQQQFVENLFDALHPYKTTGQLAFVFYHGLYDYPGGFCTQYAQSQGINDAYLCGFMNNLGLKNYVTGQPKQALSAFFNKLGTW